MTKEKYDSLQLSQVLAILKTFSASGYSVYLLPIFFEHLNHVLDTYATKAMVSFSVCFRETLRKKIHI